MTSRTVDPVYVPFNVTTPPATTAAAPLVSPVVLDHSRLELVQLQMPRGHNGATGIRFTLAGKQFLPWDDGVSWIQGDDINETFEIGVEIDRGLSVVTFNAGFHPHLFYVRFKLRQLGDATAARSLTLLPHDTLSA